MQATLTIKADMKKANSGYLPKISWHLVRDNGADMNVFQSGGYLGPDYLPVGVGLALP
jgi:hypothetical protein